MSDACKKWTTLFVSKLSGNVHDLLLHLFEDACQVAKAEGARERTWVFGKFQKYCADIKGWAEQEVDDVYHQLMSQYKDVDALIHNVLVGHIVEMSVFRAAGSSIKEPKFDARKFIWTCYIDAGEKVGFKYPVYFDKSVDPVERQNNYRIAQEKIEQAIEMTIIDFIQPALLKLSSTKKSKSPGKRAKSPRKSSSRARSKSPKPKKTPIVEFDDEITPDDSASQVGRREIRAPAFEPRRAYPPPPEYYPPPQYYYPPQPPPQDYYPPPQYARFEGSPRVQSARAENARTTSYRVPEPVQLPEAQLRTLSIRDDPQRRTLSVRDEQRRQTPAARQASVRASEPAPAPQHTSVRSSAKLPRDDELRASSLRKESAHEPPVVQQPLAVPASEGEEEDDDVSDGSDTEVNEMVERYFTGPESK
jgi:hypothetical protein